MQRLPTLALLVALLMLGSAPALCRKTPSPASEFIPAVEAILQNEDDPLDHIKILVRRLRFFGGCSTGGGLSVASRYF